MNSGLTKTIERLREESNQIPATRQTLLKEFAEYVSSKLKVDGTLALNFICTHNSRRSHISQLWAQAAAHYFGVRGITCLSGGTEATAFNERAVAAMQRVGFSIEQKQGGANPRYEVRFADGAPAVNAFSKKYDDPHNTTAPFVAVMTCSHADENCPVVIGALKRFSLTYDDPKEFDGTAQESEKYTERVAQIGRELLFAFSLVKS